MALEELDRVAQLDRQIAGINDAGNTARAVNQPEALRDVVHDLERATKLSRVATDAMREAEQATLREIAKLQRIQRRMKRKS